MKRCFERDMLGTYMEANFPKLEEKILKKWKSEKAFEISVKKRKKAPVFVFYEGPPTANGSPGIHHVISRVFKDVVCRYQTMRGFRVERRAGWDTHGLPVELQIEKKLGLKSKKEIEQYGIAKFNKECKQSVWNFKKEWDDLTERIGFWIDLKNPYITYQPQYMERLWWVIKQFHKKELLYKDYKVVPYCSRCGTPLSSHELAQGYKTVKDRSVYAKFRVTSQDFLQKRHLPKETYIVAWTTTPWTLPGNVALAVGKDIMYVVAKKKGEVYILAKGLAPQVLEKEFEILEEFSGKELEGLEYEPLFDSLKKESEAKHYVALAGFVTTEDGTGVVHTAVMYGEDDYKLGQKLGLPKRHTVDEEGKFNELAPEWKGIFVKDAEPSIIENLARRGLLLKEELYEHEYPFCWRCSTPLLYYAKESWFINMQKVKKQLLANNQKINWIPDHLKNGRMGEWLKEVKDWAFSRERYWGTPLPVWECSECNAREVAESIKDLGKRASLKNTYYLMRHGESEKQKLKVISSWPEPSELSLTAKGKKQIKAVCQELAKEKIDVIVSSDILRAKQSAQILGKELGKEVIFDEGLRENSAGTLNGASMDKVKEFYHREGETRLEHYLRRFEVKPPKGESWLDAQKRLYEFLRRMEKTYQGKRILLMSHGFPLIALEACLCGQSRKDIAMVCAERRIPEVAEWRKIKGGAFPYNPQTMEVDLHRPYVDEVIFPCKACKKGLMRRVKEVVDVWFDSGAMPFASSSVPASADEKGNLTRDPNPFPADYIVEAIDQTRGWFYTLLAVSTLLGKESPYHNVISLGHILDEKGEKMSKSKGNIVNPWQMIEKYGVDTLRWYFYTLNHPWDPKLFAEKDLQQTMRKFMLTLWNSYVFYETYAGKISKNEKSETKKPTRGKKKPEHVLDRWIVSRLQTTVQQARSCMDAYDITGAARAIDDFVINDLSLWYIRRSRNRLQNPASKEEFEEAAGTLRFVLSQVSKVAAPFIPFLSEYVYQQVEANRESVHWQDFPESDKKRMDENLETQMARVRQIVAKALAARAKAGIKVRQPLGALKLKTQKPELLESLIELMKDEVNVKEVVIVPVLDQDVELDTTITPELRREGLAREIMRNIQEMRKQGGYRPADRIVLRYSGSGTLKQIIKERQEDIQRVAGIQAFAEGDVVSQVFDVEQEFSFDGETLLMAIRRI